MKAPPNGRRAGDIGDFPLTFGHAIAKIRMGNMHKLGGRPIPHVTLGGVECKSCARCAKLLPLTEFSHDRTTSDELKSRCKSCVGTGGDSSVDGKKEKRGYR